MRIARWQTRGTTSEGFVIDDTVVAFANGLTVSDVLRGGLPLAHSLFALVDEDEKISLDEVNLIAPIVPSAIRDFVAFEEHVEGITAQIDGRSEVVPEWYQAPTFYFTNPHTVLGPGEPVVPPETDRLDFELEIAAIIGGGDGVNLTVDQGASAIFGYTIMNDWSARDLAARELRVRLGPAKGKDFGLSLGPWIVTADELERFVDDDGFLAIRAEAYVNDVLVGEDLVSNMGWKFPELVAYASRNSRIVAGDVLGSGTVGNGGCLAELWGRNGRLSPPPLTPGDIVRMKVEGIGELTTLVHAPVSVPSLPAARSRGRARARTEVSA